MLVFLFQNCLLVRCIEIVLSCSARSIFKLALVSSCKLEYVTSCCKGQKCKTRNNNKNCTNVTSDIIFDAQLHTAFCHGSFIICDSWRGIGQTPQEAPQAPEEGLMSRVPCQNPLLLPTYLPWSSQIICFGNFLFNYF